MKVVILAAGECKRLRPLTDKIPKTLINIGKTTVLHHTLKNLEKFFKKRDINIVTGHGHVFVSMAVGHHPHLIFNPEYATKNNCYSTLLGIGGVDDNVLIINSDLFCEDKLMTSFIEHIVSDPNNSFLVVDTDESKMNEESMKIVASDGILRKINKQIPLSDAMGEYVGMAYICKNDLSSFKQKLAEIVKNDPANYYEEAFQKMFDANIHFFIFPTKNNKWVEIDTLEDLEYAKKMVITFEN